MNEDRENKPAEPTNWELIKRLLKLSWKYRNRCIVVFCLQIILLTFALAGLGFTGLGIDYLRHVIDPTAPMPKWPLGIEPPSGWTPLQVIGGLAFAIFGFGCVRAIINYTYSMSVATLIHKNVVVDLRSKVYEKLQKLSFQFFDANASGSIINRATGDVMAIRMFVEGVLIQSIIMGISLFVYTFYMLSIHPLLTLACLCTTPLLWVTSIFYSKKVRPAYIENRRLMDNLVLSFSECVQGINTIKGFALEEETKERFRLSNDVVTEHRMQIFWKVSTFAPLLSFLTQLNLITLLLYGGYLVYLGELPLGTGLVVFAGLLQQFSGQVANLSSLADNMQQSLTGAKRVFEVLDAPVAIDSPENPVKIDDLKGEITFHNVHFEYKKNEVVLDDISFTAKPGEVIAIAGATGSGKSALMSLIPRFYDPTQGRITLDGVDLRDLSVDYLRKNIGLVFQDNFLFSNTIAANIAFGNPQATQEQIEKAARIAAAHGFISQMPQGYETLLGESGVNLSGGQRQRLAIARAVLLEPRILLLDDPTAAIDPETEHEILEAIENAIQGRTTFIVAHRMSTLKRADRIIVLEHGRVAQIGTHEELMATPGIYRHAVRVQAVDPESLHLIQANRERKKS